MAAPVKFKSSRKRAGFTEINVTPFVDVMLVLLVIFMVTAPMMTTGIPLDLPKGDGQTIEDTDRAVDISIDAKSKIFMGGEAVNPASLVTRLRAMQKTNPNLRIVISADKGTPYGQVIETMSLLRLAGISKVGLKTGDTLDVNKAVAPKGK